VCFADFLLGSESPEGESFDIEIENESLESESLESNSLESES